MLTPKETSKTPHMVQGDIHTAHFHYPDGRHIKVKRCGTCGLAYQHQDDDVCPKCGAMISV